MRDRLFCLEGEDGDRHGDGEEEEKRGKDGGKYWGMRKYKEGIRDEDVEIQERRVINEGDREIENETSK